jgi:hypothetical protein
MHRAAEATVKELAESIAKRLEIGLSDEGLSALKQSTNGF